MASQGKTKGYSKSTHDTEYRALFDFRQHILDYMDFSDRSAKAAGIEPRQYQLLLAIKGSPPDVQPTIGTLAKYLRIRHHSAVELIDRAEGNGFVQRTQTSRGRTVLVVLTSKGEQVLKQAVAERMRELKSAGPALVDALQRLLRSKSKVRGVQN
jgi:DNA-binding MarR family transcriptional regulator